jgi:hypothetical protein
MRRLFALIALVCIAGIANASYGDTIIKAKFVGMALGNSNTDTGDVYYNTSGVDAYIGALEWNGTGQGNPSNTPFTGTFDTYCIDMTHDFSGGTFQFVYTDILTALTGSQATNPGTITSNTVLNLEKLYSVDLPGGGVSFPTDNAKDEAAFQLAVWSIIYNPGLTSIPTYPTVGDIFTIGTNVSSAAVTQANTWLAGLSSINSQGQLVGLEAYMGSQGQAYLVSVSSPVPLPRSLFAGLLLFGLLSIGPIRRGCLRLA